MNYKLKTLTIRCDYIESHYKPIKPKFCHNTQIIIVNNETNSSLAFSSFYSLGKKKNFRDRMYAKAYCKSLIDARMEHMEVVFASENRYMFIKYLHEKPIIGEVHFTYLCAKCAKTPLAESTVLETKRVIK